MILASNGGTSSRIDSLCPEAHVVHTTFGDSDPYVVICQFPEALATSNLVDFVHTDK